MVPANSLVHFGDSTNQRLVKMLISKMSD
ncbi:hypothetical protein VSWAT3_12447 [Vibrionales bacterium SWAT-3]|nr:hypothetical protein VSWAT3_12447 [Vibrionales bacterium SWAT-3]